jgi:hypothetical protein
MSKKTIIVLLVGLALASVHLAEAQQPGKIFRIGFLDPSTASGSAVLVEAFRLNLTELRAVVSSRPAPHTDRAVTVT